MCCILILIINIIQTFTPPPLLVSPTPQHKNHYPAGHEIYNFGKPFLGHHYFILNLFDPCSRIERKKEKNITFL